MWDFVVDKVALGQVFYEYFGFPCQSPFLQLLHNHPHLSSGVCTIGQKWPQYLVDLVPPHLGELQDKTKSIRRVENVYKLECSGKDVLHKYAV
jgi:hypothetical protein